MIDKWFSLQAAIPQAATRSTSVRALTAHPAFSFANPNRVRALIGAFAQANPTQFNRADGAGYDFVADTVLALDPKNPQVAARMATAFRTWRTLEAGPPRARRKRALRAHQGRARVCRATSPTSSNARWRRPERAQYQQDFTAQRASRRDVRTSTARNYRVGNDF